MSLTFRTFTPGDYAAYVALRNRVEPHAPTSVEDLRHSAEVRYGGRPSELWLVEDAGSLVAAGGWDQQSDAYAPDRYRVGAWVDESYRRRGIARELARRIEESLRPRDPRSVYARWVSERNVAALALLRGHGFEETWRVWESVCDVATFDPAPWAGVERRFADQGFVIRTLAELAGDPGRDAKLYALDREGVEDQPLPEPLTDPGLDGYVAGVIGAPSVCPDGFLVAVQGDAYAGVCDMRVIGAEAEIDTTHVGRAFRRRGVATALKLAGMRWAQQRGLSRVQTWNAPANHGILELNDAMGFVRRPAELRLERRFR